MPAELLLASSRTTVRWLWRPAFDRWNTALRTKAPTCIRTADVTLGGTDNNVHLVLLVQQGCAHVIC